MELPGLWLRLLPFAPGARFRTGNGGRRCFDCGDSPEAFHRSDDLASSVAVASADQERDVVTERAGRSWRLIEGVQCFVETAGRWRFSLGEPVEDANDSLRWLGERCEVDDLT